MKQDPIGKKYFLPLVRTECLSTIAFYVSALLSITLFFFINGGNGRWIELLESLFILSVSVLVISETLVRLYLGPRAQIKRFQDFLGQAHGKTITSLQTKNYYTTALTSPDEKVAAQLLENSFYSEDTASQMVNKERWKIGIYLLLWLLLLLWRNISLSFLIVIFQIIFSHQILLRWLHLEWLKYQFEEIFEKTYHCIKYKDNIEVIIPELLVRYEMAKANAGITLSSKIFEQRSEVTDANWTIIKSDLNI